MLKKTTSLIILTLLVVPSSGLMQKEGGGRELKLMQGTANINVLIVDDGNGDVSLTQSILTGYSETYGGTTVNVSSVTVVSESDVLSNPTYYLDPGNFQMIIWDNGDDWFEWPDETLFNDLANYVRSGGCILSMGIDYEFCALGWFCTNPSPWVEWVLHADPQDDAWDFSASYTVVMSTHPIVSIPYTVPLSWNSDTTYPSIVSLAVSMPGNEVIRYDDESTPAVVAWDGHPTYGRTVYIAHPASLYWDSTSSGNVYDPLLRNITFWCGEMFAFAAGACVDLSPNSQSSTIPPGGSNTYQVTVTNCGTNPDTIDLSASPGAVDPQYCDNPSIWTWVINPNSVDLDPGNSTDVDVTVGVSAGAVAGSRLRLLVTGTSSNDPSVSDTVEINTTVEAITNMIVDEIVTEDHAIPKGPCYDEEPAVFHVQVTNYSNDLNTGNIEILFNTPPGWEVGIFQDSSLTNRYSDLDGDGIIEIPAEVTDTNGDCLIDTLPVHDVYMAITPPQTAGEGSRLFTDFLFRLENSTVQEIVRTLTVVDRKSCLFAKADQNSIYIKRGETKTVSVRLSNMSNHSGRVYLTPISCSGLEVEILGERGRIARSMYLRSMEARILLLRIEALEGGVNCQVGIAATGDFGTVNFALVRVRTGESDPGISTPP